MSARIPISFLVLLLVLTGALFAQDAMPTPAQQPLAALNGVRWVGPTVTPNMLRDKTTLVLVYASWCPKCNQWSGELFQQLKTATADKPVVILAINADSSPSEMQQYITQRGFFGPNIFHGYDPAIPAKLGLEDNLYNYVMIGPDGAIKAQGSAAGFFPEGAGKRFAVPSALAKATNLGSFKLITAGMSPEAATALWPLELGGISEPALRSAQGKLAPEQRAEVETAVTQYLDGRLAFIRERYKGEIPERIAAYETAAELAAAFRNAPQNQTARQVVEFMEADTAFKQEVAAKKAYDSSMRIVTENPRRRASVLKSVAKRFEGTHYGKLAAESLAADSP